MFLLGQSPKKGTAANGTTWRAALNNFQKSQIVTGQESDLMGLDLIRTAAKIGRIVWEDCECLRHAPELTSDTPALFLVSLLLDGPRTWERENQNAWKSNEKKRNEGK